MINFLLSFLLMTSIIFSFFSSTLYRTWQEATRVQGSGCQMLLVLLYSVDRDLHKRRMGTFSFCGSCQSHCAHLDTNGIRNGNEYSSSLNSNNGAGTWYLDEQCINHVVSHIYLCHNIVIITITIYTNSNHIESMWTFTHTMIANSQSPEPSSILFC